MITPPASLWEQYSIVGILFLVLAIALAGIWRAFKQYRAWKSEEASAQRVWQSGENQKREFEVANRDEAYRKFFTEMEQKRIDSANATNLILKQLSENMTALTHKLDAHDENVVRRFDTAKDEIVDALSPTTPVRRKK